MTAIPWPNLLFRRWIAFAAFVVLLAGVGLGWRSHARGAVVSADPDSVLSDPALASRALAAGAEVYARACVGCHGENGRGRIDLGVPRLDDRDRLYGEGSVAGIEEIVLHGIRSGDTRGWRLASMPAYGHPKPFGTEPIPSLKPGEIADLVEYVLSFSGRQSDTPAAGRGAALFQGRAGCWDCHDRTGHGDTAIGAPNLTDDVWLYGGSRRAITHTLIEGRAGVSPAFAKRLSPFEIRAVSVYVAALSRPKS